MKKIKKMLPAILMILFEIAVGLMLLIDPEKFTIANFIIFGAILIICAVILLVRYLKERKAADEYAKVKDKAAKRNGGREKNEEVKVSVIPLIAAICTFVIGATFAFGAGALYNVAALLFVFYGAIMIVKGIFKIADFASLRKEGSGVSWLQLVIGILSIIMGIIVMINPGNARDFVFVLSGASLLVEAALDIVALVLSYRISKKLEAEAEVIEVEDDDPYHLDNFAE